jgi:hypothetical protein
VEVDVEVVRVDSAGTSKVEEGAVAESSVIENDGVVVGRASTIDDVPVGWACFGPNNPLDDLLMSPLINPSTLSPADPRRDGVEGASASRSGDCPATSRTADDLLEVDRLRESERRKSDIDVDTVDLDAEAEDGATSEILEGSTGSSLSLGWVPEAGIGASVAPRGLSGVGGDGVWSAACSDDEDSLKEDDGRDELRRGGVLMCCMAQFSLLI